jgi:hypothetical protein
MMQSDTESTGFEESPQNKRGFHLQRSKILRSKLVSIPAIIGVLLMFIVLACRDSELPDGFTITLASKSGKDIPAQGALLLFEFRRMLQPVELWPGLPYRERCSFGNSIAYRGPAEVPQIHNYYFPLLPIGVRSLVSVYVFAPGHRFEKFDVMKVQADAEYHKNPRPKDQTGFDMFDGVTFRLTPLASEDEVRRNIGTIKSTFILRETGKGILPSRKDSEMIREFIKAEEKGLTRFRDEPPDARL